MQILIHAGKGGKGLFHNSARFIEIDPFCGSLIESSRFPQYLIKAIFGCARAVADENDINLDPFSNFSSLVYHAIVSSHPRSARRLAPKINQD